VRTLFWLLLAGFVALLGWFSYDFITRRRTQVDVATLNLSPDTVAAYRQRVTELEQRADSLSRRFASTNLLRRPDVNARITQLNAEVGALRQAIAAWEAAKGGDDLYRKCILMYGKASGVCDALAADTLAPSPGGE
jgi:hypothetical protein